MSEQQRPGPGARRADTQPVTPARLFYLAAIPLARTITFDESSAAIQWSDAAPADRLSAPPTSKTLEAFLDLADAAPQAILDFARHWGPLVRPQQEQPWATTVFVPPCQAVTFASENATEQDAEPRDRKVIWARTALGDWRRCAQQARAIMRIMTRLQHNQPGRAADWQLLQPDEATAKSVRRERQALAEIINGWLCAGAVQPAMRWDRPTAHLELHPASVLGALGALMANALDDADAFVICASCGKPHVPRRRDGADRRSFCADCGRRAATREAMRLYRERQRAAKEQAAQAE